MKYGVELSFIILVFLVFYIYVCVLFVLGCFFFTWIGERLGFGVK